MEQQSLREEQRILSSQSRHINSDEYKRFLDSLIDKDREEAIVLIPLLARRSAARVFPTIGWEGLYLWPEDGRLKLLGVVLGLVAGQLNVASYGDAAAAAAAVRVANAGRLAKAVNPATHTDRAIDRAASAAYYAALAGEAVETAIQVVFADKALADAANNTVLAAGIAVDLNSEISLSLNRALLADIELSQKSVGALKSARLWHGKVPEWFVNNVQLLEMHIKILVEMSKRQTTSSASEDSERIRLIATDSLAYLLAEAGSSSKKLGAPIFVASSKSHPECPSTIDKLNRQNLVDALAVNLTHSTNKHHRAIGLLGEWGAGKTTVLKLLKEELQKSHNEQPFVFGEFNAWAYEHTDNIQAGVAQEMINALTSAPESLESKVKDKSEPKKEKTNVNLGLVWNKLYSSIYKLPDLLNNYLFMDIRDVKTGVISFVVRRKLWVTVTWLVQRAWLTLRFSVKTHPFEILKILVLLLVAAMPWFTDWFDGLINDKDLAIVGQWVWSGGLVLYTLREFGKLIISPQAKELLTYLRLPSYAEHLGKIPVMRKHISTLCELRLKEKNGKTPRLLFVVDDLDRCSPEAIVKVLEAVRLVLDLENVIVLIAIDQHIALAALSKHFNDFAIHHKLKNSHAIAREYLSKVINLPILLTAPSGNDVRELMVDLWKDIQKDSTVDASDAGREDSIDNTPTHVTSETNLPAADSKALSDKLPVADGSPNPGFKVDVKPKISEGDQQPSGEINPIKALSPAQQQSFIHWVNYFELTNPRQLKRLNNSYDLMRSYLPQWDKEVVDFALTEEDVLKVYPMLLTLILMEYLNSLHSLTERSQLWEKLFSAPVIAGFESVKVGIPRVKVTEVNNKRVTSDFIRVYRGLLASEGNKSLASNVEAFVLPAMN